MDGYSSWEIIQTQISNFRLSPYAMIHLVFFASGGRKRDAISPFREVILAWNCSFLFMFLFLFCLSRRVFLSVLGKKFIGPIGFEFNAHVLGVLKVNTDRKES